MREIGDLVSDKGEEWMNEEMIDQIREDAEGWMSVDKRGE